MTSIDPVAVHWAQEKRDRARELRRALANAEDALRHADRAVRAAALSDTGEDPADFGDTGDALAWLEGAARRVRSARRIADNRHAAAEEAWDQATTPRKPSGMQQPAPVVRVIDSGRCRCGCLERVHSMVLNDGARRNPGQLDHLIEHARRDRADAAMVAAHAAELAAQGVTVAAGTLPDKNLIMYWAGPDGEQLTPETHTDCPGNVVTLMAWGYNPRQARESWHCTDPRGHGHKKHRASGEPDEEAALERSKVTEGNKAWRAATSVRQTWLRDVLLAHKDLPAGAALFTARAIAAADSFLLNSLSTMSGGTHKTARELLGSGKPDYDGGRRTEPLLGLLEGISEQRAQVVTLALVLGAYEQQAADPWTWRHPSPAPREYLTALAGWGYTLSPVEQGVADAARTAAQGTATAAGEETRG